MIDRYTRPEMGARFSDKHRYETWLEVELAACAAMEAEGNVPAGTADAVRGVAAGHLDERRILEIEQTTRHDIIAFLTHVEEIAGAKARWLHLGMTSSDVLDTATAITLRDACDQLLSGIDLLRAACRRRAEELRGVPCIGRTHGIHAEPTSLGLTFLRWYAELGRARSHLAAAREAIAVGKIAGAVGNYANLEPAVERRALANLGLRPEDVATQVVGRDRHAELLCAVAMAGGAVESMALTIRHWQRTEVGEAEEPFGRGQKGSSAMPHKKNPILSENLCGLARLLRGYATAGLEDVALWHERDISHSSVERVALADATILLDFMLDRATRLVDGLVIHRERIRENLERTRGLVYSEAVLLELVRTGMPRQKAYERVQAAALAAHEGRGGFQDLLAADPEITSRVPRDVLAAAFDLSHHLRHVDAIYRRVLDDTP